MTATTIMYPYYAAAADGDEFKVIFTALTLTKEIKCTNPCPLS